ncbi:MAG: hypothetical protein ACRD9S_02960 [Pyrinomonadaceae bacterium]
MTTRRIKLALVAAALMLVSIAALSVPSSVRAGEESGPGLEGSWVDDVTIVSGFNAGTTIKNLSTYSQGGGLLTLPAAVPPPLQSSAGHGSWIHTQGHKFSNTIVNFIYDPTGQLVAVLKIHQNLTLGEQGDEYNGNASFDVFDPAGNPIPGFSGCSTFLGKRIRVEPPSTCP